MKQFCSVIFKAAILYFLMAVAVAQNPPDYEQRRLAYIDSALANFVPNAITIQAYANHPVNQPALDTIDAKMLTSGTIDFDIVKLIRVLLLSNGTYDAQLLPSLAQVPYWLTKDEVLRGYWSENHMIMWMSSDWLMHEYYGKMVDASLESRLKHYLNLKITYGFYEFFSSTYATYCLSGLLNLADFAQDSVIRNSATLAAQRLLTELLMPATEQGVFYPAAGRNYYEKYQNPYGQNHHHLIYLLTGNGPAPSTASHSGGFLATSSLNVNPIINSWSADLDTVYHVGHSIDSMALIHQSQVYVDRMMFVWSAGGYFHPYFAAETGQLLVDSNFWDHIDFEPVKMLSYFDPVDLPILATEYSSISKSSVTTGQDVAIFKNGPVVLTSVQDYWKGKLGYQQFPVVATVGNTAVFPASGKVVADWKTRQRNNANDHLPYVQQKNNVALIMFRGEEKPFLYGKTIGTVALHWHQQDFDETTESGNWLIGRQGSGFIAVRRHCTEMEKGYWACDTRDGQTWIMAVGNDDMYGSFSNFINVVNQSVFDETWSYDSATEQWIYSAEVTFDGVDLSYAWSDSLRITSVQSQISGSKTINIHPNPVQQEFQIDLSAFNDKSISIEVHSVLGRKVYGKTIQSTNGSSKTIDASSWRAGMYVVTVYDPESGKSWFSKLMKQ